MMCFGWKIGVLLLAAACLAGCVSDSHDDGDDASPVRAAGALPQESGRNSVTSQPGQQTLQCVPYAREHSQIKLFGDAYTWWNQAAGKYGRGARPAAGAVMVLANYAGPQRGHVAVVRKVVSPREIRINHANWLDDGSIYVNDPVVDVSAANDWTMVKVWNIKTGSWGTKVFPVQGFIWPGSASALDNSQPNAASPDRDAVVADASLADTQMVEVRSKSETQSAEPGNLVWDEGREVAPQKMGRLPRATAPAPNMKKKMRAVAEQRP